MTATGREQITSPKGKGRRKKSERKNKETIEKVFYESKDDMYVAELYTAGGMRDVR